MYGTHKLIRKMTSKLLKKIMLCIIFLYKYMRNCCLKSSEAILKEKIKT